MNIIKDLEQYMFSSKNMMKYNKSVITITKPEKKEVHEPVLHEPILHEPILHVPVVHVPVVHEPIQLVVKEQHRKKEDSFTPVHKDKLFWCFYVLLNGFNEYELNKTGHYAVEKAFKIKTVEKLREMKSEIKALKLKINEVEDELVNKEQITLKGLHVLCLVYKVSITYIYGKKYCEFLYGDDIKGIISQHKQYKGTHSLLYEDLHDFKQTHWYIENPQKPLNAITAYTLKELQDICIKLEIPLKNDLVKSKTKKDLYEEILTKL